MQTTEVKPFNSRCFKLSQDFLNTFIRPDTCKNSHIKTLVIVVVNVELEITSKVNECKLRELRHFIECDDLYRVVAVR